jgi:hypothetical protein
VRLARAHAHDGGGGKPLRFACAVRTAVLTAPRAPSFAGVIKSHSGDIATAAKEWVERYEGDADAALAELFQFVIKARSTAPAAIRACAARVRAPGRAGCGRGAARRAVTARTPPARGLAAALRAVRPSLWRARAADALPAAGAFAFLRNASCALLARSAAAPPPPSPRRAWRRRT